MLKLDQKGFSIALSMVMAALIAANTIYFMNLSKVTSVTNALRATQASELAEKRRIGSLLSDSAACTAVFSSQNLTTLSVPKTPPFDLQINGFSFLKSSAASTYPYLDNSHRADTYWIAADRNLYIRYSLSPSKIASSGKKTALIKIPLNIKVDGGNNITECYANQNLTVVNLTADNACTGNAAWPDLVGATCTHNVVATTLPVVGAIGGGTFFNTVTLTPTNELQLSTTAPALTTTTYFPAATACASSPLSLAISLSSLGTLVCAAPSVNACANGTMLIMVGTTPTCTDNATAAVGTRLFNSISPGGADTYYTKPTSSCPAGTYAATYDANGNVTSCGDISIKNKDCLGGNYATDLDTGISVNPLKCTAYSKVKACATPGAYTWVSSLATPTPTCISYPF